MTKKIMTVCGAIDSENLGVTLPHEHILIDLRSSWKGFGDNDKNNELFKESIKLNNRGKVVYNTFNFIENMYHLNINDAIKELNEFKEAGGCSVVDVTSCGLGRDPKMLYKVSKKTGLNILMGAGNYASFVWTEEMKKRSIEDIKNEILNDFENGVTELKIKPGVIGEIGIWDFTNDLEIKSLIAAAKAQKIINCALFIHPPIWETFGNNILDILEKEKVNLNKVVLCHCDPTLENYDYHDSLAKRGAFIEYDLWGAEFMSYEGWFLPSDGDRIKAVKEQIKRSNLNRILFSYDACFKISFKKWGGFGYTHIIENIIPRLKQAGISDEQINQIIIENPKNLLSF
ncbi:MAG: hypothetical protein M1326_05395 [Cyanobacteria bacterium]|nr:hypothetical protein [Cyanobacteriota bacterium]